MDLHPFTEGVATSMGILKVRISSQQVEPIKKWILFMHTIWNHLKKILYMQFTCVFFFGGGRPKNNGHLSILHHNLLALNHLSVTGSPCQAWASGDRVTEPLKRGSRRREQRRQKTSSETYLGSDLGWPFFLGLVVGRESRHEERFCKN